MISLRLRWLVAAGLVALLGAVAQGGSPPPTAPRLVLVLSVDQMRPDYLTRFEPLLRGGLRTLTTRGAVFTNARYGHAHTETGPGHSVILSGRHAPHTGIVANLWFDPLEGRLVNVVEDPVHSPVGGAGRGASPVHFLSHTIGDLLKKRTPASRVVGLSMKDRSAILMGGRRADAAYWYEDNGGNFITSTYYMPSAPRWLVAWNARRRPDSLAGRSWTRLLPDEALYRKYAGPDDVEGEWDRVDTTFPHVIRGQPPEWLFYNDVRRTPFADELLVEAALEAMAAHGLGEDDVTDILAIGLSATDVIGHTYGPDSQEVMDQMLRLDALLQRLFEQVDRRVGAGRTLVVLSADHGVMPLAEVARERGVDDARRLSPRVLDAAVRAALQLRYPGADDLIAGFDNPDFYLDLDALRRRGLSRAEVEVVCEKALRETGLVAGVYTHARLLGEPPGDDPYFGLFRESFYQPRSAHLMVRLREHVYLDDRPGGTGHGQPYEDDRHVPVVFMGAGVRGGSYAEPCGPEDIAPTLAALLGLEYRLEGSQRVLSAVK